MSKNFIVTIAGIFLIIFLYVFTRFEFHFFPYPEIDTVFAKDFTKEKFAQVPVGATENEVENLLGEPIDKRVTIGNDRNCWQYSHDGKAGPFADFSYYMFLVCFDDEKVISTPVHEVFD